MKKLFKGVLLSLIVTVLFSFVSEQTMIAPKGMTFVGSIAEPFRQEGVFIGAKTYTPQESRAYLHRNLLQSGYQPVQITIQNNSAKTYFISQDGVKIATASPNQVALAVSSKALPRSVAFKVAGFFFWPFLIPGTLDSIITFHGHMKMVQSYRAKSIKEEKEPIPAYSTINRVLFVSREELKESFALRLQETKTGRFHTYQILIDETS